MVETITDNTYENFSFLLQELKEATSLMKADKSMKLISQVDKISLTDGGIDFLYERILELEAAGIFANTAWSEPARLVPSLVNGTFKSGHPNSTYELLSDLRMLALSERESSDHDVNSAEAMTYLEEVMVHNLEFVFKEVTEETRLNMTEDELNKVFNLFTFILKKCRLDGIKEKLAEEITLICEQRPVVTRRAREIIQLIKNKVSLDVSQASDRLLQHYIDVLFAPSQGAKKNSDFKKYQAFLNKASRKTLQQEASEMGEIMRKNGLVSTYHAYLVLHLLNNKVEDLIPEALRLSETGEAEWNYHQKMVKKLLKETLHPYNNQFLYGLAKMLENGLFSRNAVKAGLENISNIRIHPMAEEKILQSIVYPQPDLNALQYLTSALIRILGQPLGVGQGNNPTCQSARGISMWSQHAPAKLINMVITVATQDNLILRFDEKELEANKLGKGLVEKLDHNLDALSVILVPKIDKIYNQMMTMASGRGDDPHKWVNPALYGHWIQVGFASVYSYLFNAIHDFKGFMKIFYAACHPEYNGGRQLVYPNPIGIYITSSKGAMVGFHAISLLRVKKDPSGVMRAYFLNPNNEGRQDWGQGIKPSVFGNGEKRGESSLPFYQFAARVYAFHYNSLEIELYTDNVDDKEIVQVEQLAKESWGKAYVWIDTKKEW